MDVKSRDETLLEAGWPWPLVKALTDNYEYHVGLRDGSVVRFTSAEEAYAADELSTAWVTIRAEGLKIRGPLQNQLENHLDVVHPARGLVLRVSQIVWAVDGYK